MSGIRVTSDLVVYGIDASRCRLHVGDLVAPGMAIGESTDSGSVVEAESHGRVQGIYLNGADHALIVLVRLVSASAADAELTLIRPS